MIIRGSLLVSPSELPSNAEPAVSSADEMSDSHGGLICSSLDATQATRRANHLHIHAFPDSRQVTLLRIKPSPIPETIATTSRSLASV